MADSSHSGQGATPPHPEVPSRQRLMTLRSERGQAVTIRNKDETHAMGWDERFKLNMRKMFKGDSKQQVGGSMIDVEKGTDTAQGHQFRIETASKTAKRSLIDVATGKPKHPSAIVVGIPPHRRMAYCLHWMFRVNFLFLFAVMTMFFFALAIFFAGIITILGQAEPSCVRIGGAVFDSEGNAFADAFALSWTTLSTVGYGNSYPALSTQNSSSTNCFFINFFCAMESLVGVIYSGFCGAILFGKVLRIQSQAQVVFSDPIVIRYGQGLKDNSEEMKEDEDESTTEDNEDPAIAIPCPVLEFRVVNKLYGEVGGEIMDATLNVAANTDAHDSETVAVTDKASTTASDTSDEAHHSKTSQQLHRLMDKLRHTHSIDEDPASHLVNKQIFSKMNIEAGDHPFFKRVWLARHTLDENSPIVKPRVRKQIARSGGYWPSHLNNPEGIRDSLQFNQILVSINGVSNVSASDVYSQKIYDPFDVHIGYQFVNILYRNYDGALGVDIDLINDVREQNGGGGESLF